MIKITLGGPQATVELKARRALDGSLLIMDHRKIDIAVIPNELKVVTYPKSSEREDVYYYQDRLLELLANRGIIGRESIQGGNIFRSLEATLYESENPNSLQAAVYVIAEFIKHESEMEQVADQYERDLESFYTQPDDRNSTELGEVPQQAEKGGMRPGYYYYPLRYRY
jgi:hypothetical protein